MGESISNDNYGLIDLIGSGYNAVEDLISSPYQEVKNLITGDYPDPVPAKEAYEIMSSFALENGLNNPTDPNTLEYRGKEWDISFDRENSLLTITRNADNTVMFQGDRDTLYAYTANEREMSMMEVTGKYMELEEQLGYGMEME